jgi:4-hydroxy-tetrahydrodipicolinate synthase
MRINGVWLPIVTPFLNGQIDYHSYRSLIGHYIDKGISGIMPLGTTGECPVIDDYETEKIVDMTVETANKRVPVFIGIGGNDTKKTVERIVGLEKYGFDGILSVVPYYSRPDQNGIYRHFKCISESTDRDIVIYNIPYRTGVNMENDTLFRLAELKNIVGVKDSCGNIRQSMELIFNKPENFSVLTGEDLLYYLSLSLGGDGGILASAHIDTEKFVKIYRLMKSNSHHEALSVWKELADLIGLLFAQPNPAPLKYLLKMKRMINDDSTRLPITPITDDLKSRLDRFV